LELGGDAVRGVRERVVEAWRRGGVVLLVAGLAMLAAACLGGTSGAPPPFSSPPPSGGSASGGAQAASGWIVVFRVTVDPSDLDAETARLAPILGSAVRASPVQCFRGLPASAGRGYLLGAVARTKPEVRALVARAGLAPLFIARVDELCLD
jgi:hypothetical protein